MATLFAKSKAYSHIRAKLLSGDFSPGRGLSNRALARELGISPIPVREAICQLEAEGVLEQRPRSGTYVRTLSKQEWLDLFELRELLESNAVFHAATRIKPRQLATMQARCDGFRRLIQGAIDCKEPQWQRDRASGLIENDLSFHQVILEAAGNPLALKMIDQFRIMSLVFDTSLATWPPADAQLIVRLEENLREHLDILDALRGRDPERARAVMNRHFATARRWSLFDLEQLASRRNAAR